MALFSEDVGEAFIGLLSSLGIEVVWSEAGQWCTSSISDDSVLRQPIAP
jgi:hypothetical protein